MLMPVSLERTEEISFLCKNLLSIEKIICASVVNNRGKIIESEFKNNMLNLSDTELEMLYMQRALQTSMIKELDCKLGRWSYTITDRDFIMEIVIPFDDGMIFIAAESGIKIHNLIPQIHEIIDASIDIDAKESVSC